eukprot:3412935-Amphidinium_carterae.1
MTRLTAGLLSRNKSSSRMTTWPVHLQHLKDRDDCWACLFQEALSKNTCHVACGLALCYCVVCRRIVLGPPGAVGDSFVDNSEDFADDDDFADFDFLDDQVSSSSGMQAFDDWELDDV